MKKLRGKLIVALCLVLLLPAILLAVAGSLPAVYEESYYAELPELVRRADKAEGKKLLLIGGSSVAFGTDTELLEELLAREGYEYTVCPLGLYAGGFVDVGMIRPIPARKHIYPVIEDGNVTSVPPLEMWCARKDVDVTTKDGTYTVTADQKPFLKSIIPFSAGFKFKIAF